VVLSERLDGPTPLSLALWLGDDVVRKFAGNCKLVRFP
jgi:hypothetical protein